MMRVPSRSASLSAVRENFSSTEFAPSPMPSCANWPSMEPLLPSIPLASRAGNWMRLALEAWLVPWRSATCAISCASTPATCASLSAAASNPVCTKAGPPGSAKALMDLIRHHLERVRDIRPPPAWTPVSSRCAGCSRPGCRSRTTVYCFSIWAAASFPNWMSWSLENRFQPGLSCRGPCAAAVAASSITNVAKLARLIVPRQDYDICGPGAAQTPFGHAAERVKEGLCRSAGGLRPNSSARFGSFSGDVAVPFSPPHFQVSASVSSAWPWRSG